MLITIEIKCPHCHSPNITRNGKKNKDKHNYLCKNCSRQFIRDHERTYRGTLSWVKNMIKDMLVRGIGIRDMGIILHISSTTVLKVLKSTKSKINPKQTHNDCREIDEFWTHVGKKKNKVGLIYAYHRETGETVTANRRFAVWGKRDLRTAQKLRERIKRLGICNDG